jgi:IS1 family transposase
MPCCPDCHTDQVIKNGSNATGKPKYACKACGRQFVDDPQWRAISDETKGIIDRLLHERISLAGIARVVGVSERWLQTYGNEKYAGQPRQVQVRSKTKGRLTVEWDELWSFVGNKDQKQWDWLALDHDTREIVGVAVGARDEATARHLWESLPAVYRQCAVCSSDFWDAYACVLPSKRHHPVGKKSGQTSPIDRLNNTLRQRISRLVRKTLSFSKKVENHSGAIWYFVHHYNASLA